MAVRDIRKFVEYVIKRVRQRIRPPARAHILRTVPKVNGSTVQLGVTALEQGGDDRKELFQQFGFRSAPPAGTKAIVVFIGGDPSQPVVIATDGMELAEACPPGGQILYVEGGIFLKVDAAKAATLDLKSLIATILESLVLTATGAVSIQSSAAATITAAGALNLNGSVINLGSGGAGVLTANSTIKSDSNSDPAFWAWVSALDSWARANGFDPGGTTPASTSMTSAASSESTKVMAE